MVYLQELTEYSDDEKWLSLYPLKEVAIDADVAQAFNLDPYAATFDVDGVANTYRAPDATTPLSAPPYEDDGD